MIVVGTGGYKLDPQMLHTLEYDRIIDQLIEQATSETGKKAAADLQPCSAGG